MTSVTVDRVVEVATFWLDSGRPTLSAALVFAILAVRALWKVPLE